MTKLAILGGTSYVAKDYISSIAGNASYEVDLFSRSPEKVDRWLAETGRSEQFSSYDYSRFADGAYDAVVNFIGVGDAVRMAQMGAEILDVTDHYDRMVLSYLKRHSNCRYIFMSSGGVYGGTFPQPANANSQSVLSVNQAITQEYYSLSKIYAEYKHRSLKDCAITDIRIFNYFSRSQDINNNYFMCVLLRAIRDDVELQVTDESMVRDYIHPEDFYQLLDRILDSAPANTPVDCYTKAPVDKESLLIEMKQRFGLRYNITSSFKDTIRDFTKNYYYSENRVAEKFGYQPAYSSLEGLVKESAAILQQLGKA